MNKYEVVFLLEGYVTANVGTPNFYGIGERGAEGKFQFTLKDARVYYNVEAKSMVEAYDKAEKLLNTEDFGDVTITGYKFMHLYFDGEIWNEKDLRRMGCTKDFVVYPGREDDDMER